MLNFHGYRMKYFIFYLQTQTENVKEVSGAKLQNGNPQETVVSNTAKSEASEVKEDEAKENNAPELPSNKKTDEVYGMCIFP